jgi:bacteriorhodopsin|tara:strand:+ start:183 stop:914 length:732 start_codon:yes stop_codon:yes gene_type:complete
MDSYTYYSFYITCSFLVTTGTITFIEALRTNIVPMRHILNLETCISIIAAYFYGKFISMLEPMKKDIIEGVDEQNLDEKEKEARKAELAKLQNQINDTRYVDWMITTPIMLLVLILAFQYNSGVKGVKFPDFVLILLLNYGMLGSGYLGERNVVHKPTANMIGFLFFGGLYGFLYYKYLMKTKNGNNVNNQMLFAAFFILWAFYGIFYLMKESLKNTGYNILDLLSKCFVGIYFWSYSSNIFV